MRALLFCLFVCLVWAVGDLWQVMVHSDERSQNAPDRRVPLLEARDHPEFAIYVLPHLKKTLTTPQTLVEIDLLVTTRCVFTSMICLIFR